MLQSIPDAFYFLWRRYKRVLPHSELLLSDVCRDDKVMNWTGIGMLRKDSTSLNDSKCCCVGIPPTVLQTSGYEVLFVFIGRELAEMFILIFCKEKYTCINQTFRIRSVTVITTKIIMFILVKFYTNNAYSFQTILFADASLMCVQQLTIFKACNAAGVYWELTMLVVGMVWYAGRYSYTYIQSCTRTTTLKWKFFLEAEEENAFRQYIYCAAYIIHNSQYIITHSYFRLDMLYICIPMYVHFVDISPHKTIAKIANYQHCIINKRRSIMTIASEECNCYTK